VAKRNGPRANVTVGPTVVKKLISHTTVVAYCAPHAVDAHDCDVSDPDYFLTKRKASRQTPTTARNCLTTMTT
jgi:hypothetical protein